MVPTRRQALAGGASLLAALAGCTDGTETRSPPDERGRFDRPEHVAMDPPTVTLRRPGHRDPIVTVPETDEQLDRTEREFRRAVERGFVASPEAASLLRVDDVEGGDAARRFLEQTDFDTSFVYVDRGSVQQCYRNDLCYVTWTPAELRLTYAEVYRDYDVACTTDAWDRVARFIRLEGSVDVRHIERGGTHTRRGGCPIPRWKLDERMGQDDASPPANDTESRTGSSPANAPAGRLTR